ncbi:hypothetical protein SAMN05443637_10583 [Pseudonocardia thermophila]|jgi:hypothetical protein|uniref:Uncharacterized protein n=1 Tax=Pseudonocardia thermophila TaxID=1848 RepID=A0A1M6RNI7_PSETH|nr:hypothetical protein [Pseudonocardia thermophila]SHK34022.1 hypothetical protein SAMN05443637_10583 [Pseudonocardia thermophila]
MRSAPYDHGHNALLTLFAAGPALAVLVPRLGAVALLAGFPAVLLLALAMEAVGRRRDPQRRRAS